MLEEGARVIQFQNSRTRHHRQTHRCGKCVRRTLYRDSLRLHPAQLRNRAQYCFGKQPLGRFAHARRGFAHRAQRANQTRRRSDQDDSPHARRFFTSGHLETYVICDSDALVPHVTHVTASQIIRSHSRKSEIANSIPGRSKWPRDLKYPEVLPPSANLLPKESARCLRYGVRRWHDCYGLDHL